MEESLLYNLFESGLLREWRNKAKEENDSKLIQAEKEIAEELTKELNEKNIRLLTSYVVSIEDRMDNLYHNLCIKILNFAVKLGMDLQKAFAEWE